MEVKRQLSPEEAQSECMAVVGGSQALQLRTWVSTGDKLWWQNRPSPAWQGRGVKATQARAFSGLAPSTEHRSSHCPRGE